MSEFPNPASLLTKGCGWIAVFAFTSASIGLTSAQQTDQVRSRSEVQILRQANEKKNKGKSVERVAKPFVIFKFTPLPNGDHEAHVRVINFGSTTLSNLKLQIRDPLLIGDPAREDDPTKEWKTITFPDVASAMSVELYSTKVVKGDPEATYRIFVSWDGGSYVASYSFKKTETKEGYSIYSMSIVGADGKEPKDLKDFFPQVPKEVWADFDTRAGKIRSTP